MIYLDSFGLPSWLSDGKKLCLLWFLTKEGKASALSLKKKEVEALLDSVTLISVSNYKIIKSGNELLNIGSNWFVGDGLGRIIYSPARNSSTQKEYENGSLPITAKYEVTVK